MIDDQKELQPSSIPPPTVLPTAALPRVIGVTILGILMPLIGVLLLLFSAAARDSAKGDIFVGIILGTIIGFYIIYTLIGGIGILQHSERVRRVWLLSQPFIPLFLVGIIIAINCIFHLDSRPYNLIRDLLEPLLSFGLILVVTGTIILRLECRVRWRYLLIILGSALIGLFLLLTYAVSTSNAERTVYNFLIENAILDVILLGIFGFPTIISTIILTRPTIRKIFQERSR